MTTIRSPDLTTLDARDGKIAFAEDDLSDATRLRLF
jgi:hypothetical protein